MQFYTGEDQAHVAQNVDIRLRRGQVRTATETFLQFLQSVIKELQFYTDQADNCNPIP